METIDRRGAAFGIGAVALASLLGLVATQLSLRGGQMLVGLLLIALGIIFERQPGPIPVIFRPAPIAFISLAGASVATTGMSDADFQSDYFPLWALQVVGFTIGLFLIPKIGEHRVPNVDPARLLSWSRVLFFGALAMGALYFATQGIPTLGGNLEQSRVDAAEGGSGYIRMFAFLMPTITLFIVAVRGKKAWPFVLVSLLFMVGVGNRIPVVYFLVPLLAMAAIVSARKIGSGKILAAGAILFILVGAAGAYRITTQPELRYDPKFRNALLTGNFTAVGVAAVQHYAEVIPENAVLTKKLVDGGAIEQQHGRTYVTLFASALPGKQLSPDMMVREASHKKFFGGGIPPTLAGEGYMNFGYLGVILNGAAVTLLLRFWSGRVKRSDRDGERTQLRINAVVYGYVMCWCVFAQTSGFAGSATVSLAGFLVLVGLRFISTRGAGSAPLASHPQPSATILVP